MYSMKIERINENQLRFTVWTEDLPDEDLNIADLAGHTEKADELIKYLMEKAREEFGFEVEQNPVVIEAMPVNKDCIVFLVTKVDGDEQDPKYSYVQQLREQALELARNIKNNHSVNANEVEKESTVVDRPVDGNTGKIMPYMIYTSGDLEDFITVAKIVEGYYDSDNTLYKAPDDKNYFLIVSHNRNTNQEFQHLCDSMREFTEAYGFNYATKYYMEEALCLRR